MISPQAPGATLIIGQESMIGGALTQALCLSGQSVFGTTRHADRVDMHCQFLDLDGDINRVIVPDGVRYAVFCAGVTDQRACEEAPTHTQKINVDHTLRVIEALNVSGVRTLFLSTNLVLACDRPGANEFAPFAPIGVYGRQKADVEQALGQMDADNVIVRLSKVLSVDQPLISRWIEALRAEERVQAFSDLSLSPISLKYSIAAILRVLKSDVTGVFHVAGADEVSYCVLAKAMAHAMHQDANYVECVDSESASVALVGRPRHPSLGGQRLERVFGIVPQPFAEMIADLGIDDER